MNIIFAPPVLSEETLACYVIRISTLAFCLDSRNTNNNLFGRPFRAPDALLPRSLLTFFHRLRQPEMGDISHWVNRHTHFPYFCAGASAKSSQSLFGRMLASDKGPVRPIRRSSLAEWLTDAVRICSECAKCDMTLYGTAYIHRTHMSPYVTRCPYHGNLLSKIRCWAPGHFPLSTSSTSEFGDQHVQSIKSSIMFARWSELILHYGNMLDIHWRKNILAVAGALSPSGSFRNAAVVRKVCKTFSDGFDDQELTAVLKSEYLMANLLRTLALTKQQTNPVGLILFLAAHFDVAEDIFRIGKLATLSHLNGKTGYLIQGKESGNGSSTLQIAVECAHPPRFDAAALSPNSVTKKKDVCGHSSKINREARKTIESLLIKMESVQSIAQKTGFSLSTIYRIRVEIAEIFSQAQAAENLSKCSRYRERWLHLVDSKRDFGMKNLRVLAPRLWGWLYRNDRKWLEINRPTPKRKKQKLNQRNHTQEIDEDVLKALVNSAKNIVQGNSRPKRVTLLSLASNAGISRHYLYSNALKATLEKANYLCEEKTKFVRRRLDWAIERLLEQGLPLRSWRIIKTSGLRKETVDKSEIDIANLIHSRKSCL